MDAIKVIDKYLEILEKCRSEAGYGWMTEEDYQRLRELGLLGEDDRILNDPYYDIECVKFVKKILKKIKEEIMR